MTRDLEAVLTNVTKGQHGEIVDAESYTHQMEQCTLMAIIKKKPKTLRVARPISTGNVTPSSDTTSGSPVNEWTAHNFPINEKACEEEILFQQHDNASNAKVSETPTPPQPRPGQHWT